MNLATRAIILFLASFGVYKMFPQIAEPVDYYVKNPQFQEQVVLPIIEKTNAALPSKIQIPTPVVLGSETSAYDESPIKKITEDVGQKVASMAAEQVVVIKNAAQNQVCQALLEKLQSECGQ